MIFVGRMKVYVFNKQLGDSRKEQLDMGFKCYIHSSLKGVLIVIQEIQELETYKERIITRSPTNTSSPNLTAILQRFG